jgi:tetrahydromethanopterin S-methyltransferase subunit G
MGRPPREPAKPTPDPNQIEGGTMDRSQFNQMGAELDARLTERINARMDLVQQRVDSQVNALEREISVKLDSKPGYGTMIGLTVAIIGIIVTVIVGFLAFGGATFSGGMSASGAFADQLVERERREAATDRKIDELMREIRQLPPPQSRPPAANSQ